MALPTTPEQVALVVESLTLSTETIKPLTQSDIFSRWMRNPQQQIFYCPTCDSMVYIGRMAGFKPDPWRTDTFAWRKPMVNAP